MTEKQILIQLLEPGPDLFNAHTSDVLPHAVLSPPPPLPFAETEKQIFNQVLKAHPDFSSEPWPHISDPAKDLLRRMLHPDPHKRIQAADVLRECHLRCRKERLMQL